MDTLPQGLASLPNELILLIFKSIQLITDKRQFLRTCKFYNNLTKKSMLNYEEKYEVKLFAKIKEHSVEKFTLELCHDKYFDMIPNHYIISNNKILVEALAAFNCVKLLQVVMERNFKVSKVCDYASLNGSLDVLKWAKSINLSMEIIAFLDNGSLCKSNICSNAALNGHLNILKWAKEIGLKMDTLVLSHAALGCHLEILNWAKENGCGWYMEDLVKNAARGGDIEILKWVKAIGGEWNYFTCGQAARHGNLKALKWLHANGAEVNTNTSLHAANHLEILKWLHKIGCPMDSSTCTSAALKGNLDCLKFARANGCDWDNYTYMNAVHGNNKELIDWVIENGCPIF